MGAGEFATSFRDDAVSLNPRDSIGIAYKDAELSKAIENRACFFSII